MHRSPRVLLAWTIVVVVAIVTVRVVANDLAALHRRARTLGPDVHVLLAARALPLGATLTPSDLHVVVRPAATVPPDAMRDSPDAIGRVVAIDLARDDLVRAVHLAPRERTGLDGIVPMGRRAIHIPVRDGFRPAVGAVVDVLAAFDPAVSVAGAGNTATTVARGARVLAVDDDAQSGTEGGSGVTLLVTEGEAGAVVYAAGNGSVSIALAPPETACCTSSTSSPGP
jgi:Flp pilus assembly protein CpaB